MHGEGGNVARGGGGAWVGATDSNLLTFVSSYYTDTQLTNTTRRNSAIRVVGKATHIKTHTASHTSQTCHIST